jgi:hypothetical protein
VLDKKVPKNPKYDKVKSTINTGKTMKDVEVVSKYSNMLVIFSIAIGD